MLNKIIIFMITCTIIATLIGGSIAFENQEPVYDSCLRFKNYRDRLIPDRCKYINNNINK